MALIKCPECSNAVSDQAASCPRCGYPFGAAPQPSSASVDAQVKETLLRQGKIAAIKLYRDQTPGVDLAQAKQHVERIEAELPPEIRRARAAQGCLSLLLIGGLFVAAVIALLLFKVWPGA